MAAEQKGGITRARLKRLVKEISGATIVGVTNAHTVPDRIHSVYRQWIDNGFHAGMGYMERYEDVRRDPRLLLAGARTIIMAAFSYANPEAVRTMRTNGVPLIAEYALGDDYHTVLRQRLSVAAETIRSRFGGETRVCVDTAPLRERYWAQQAGIGFIGRNNYLIVPGHGAHFYLAAILWTGNTTDGADEPCANVCRDCSACIKACPMGALKSDGSLDARKCLSYITIESREPLPENINSGGRIFGCDTCRRVCPHEPENPLQTPLDEFVARPDVMNLNACDWRDMTSVQFNRIFRNSAVKRAKLDRLKSFL